MQETPKVFTVFYKNKLYYISSKNNFNSLKDNCRKNLSIPYNIAFELYNGIQLINESNFNKFETFSIKINQPSQSMNTSLYSSMISYTNNNNEPIKLYQSMMIQPNIYQTTPFQNNKQCSFSYPIQKQNPEESQKNIIYSYILNHINNYVNDIIQDYAKYKDSIVLKDYLDNINILFSSHSNVINYNSCFCTQCRQPIYNVKYQCNHCQSYIICDKCFHRNIGTDNHPYSFTVLTLSQREEENQQERNFLSQTMFFSTNNVIEQQNTISSLNRSVIGGMFKNEIMKPKQKPITVKGNTKTMEQKKIDDFIKIIDENFRVREKYYINDITSAVIESGFDEEKTMDILLNKEYCILKR